MKELATKQIKIRPSTQKRLEAKMNSGSDTFDSIITKILDEAGK